MFADTEVHISARVIEVGETFFAIDEGHRRGGKIGRPSDELRDLWREHVENFAARNASGHPFGVRCEGFEPSVPAVGQLAIEDRLDFGGLFGMCLGVLG